MGVVIAVSSLSPSVEWEYLDEIQQVVIGMWPEFSGKSLQ